MSPPLAPATTATSSRWANLWAPFEFSIIVALCLVNNHMQASVCEHMESSWRRVVVQLLLTGVKGPGAPFVSLLGMVVDFHVEHIWTDVSLFNPTKRPRYSGVFCAQKHMRFWLNSFGLELAGLIFIRRLLLQERSGFIATDMCEGRSTDLTPVLEYLASLRSLSVALKTYVFLALTIQTTLLISDFAYCSFHIIQHRFKWIYRASLHDYHHGFRYPLAVCGPWLSVPDMLLSAIVFSKVPCVLMMAVSHSLGALDGMADALHTLLRCVLGLYIHLMNHYAHCGKPVPIWSGFPLCPSLGFAFGWHDGIPCHESHHNFHSCGFGLLSVADKMYGTFNVPVTHPKYAECQQRLRQNGWSRKVKTNALSKDVLRDEACPAKNHD